MSKLVTKELMELQRKLESLETIDYKEKFTQEELELFKLDIKLTMNLLLRLEAENNKNKQANKRINEQKIRIDDIEIK